jgi:hypothetical protein
VPLARLRREQLGRRAGRGRLGRAGVEQPGGVLGEQQAGQATVTPRWRWPYRSCCGSPPIPLCIVAIRC